MFDYLIYEAEINSFIPTADDERSWIFIDDRSEYLVYSDGQSLSHGGCDTSPGWSTNVLGFGFSQNYNITDLADNSSAIGPNDASSTVSLNFTGNQPLIHLSQKSPYTSYSSPKIRGVHDSV